MIKRCLYHPRKKARWILPEGLLACGYCRWLGIKRRDWKKEQYQPVNDQPAKKVMVFTVDPEIESWIRNKAKSEHLRIGDVIEDAVISVMANE